jgi:hypothetical protein
MLAKLSEGKCLRRFGRRGDEVKLNDTDNCLLAAGIT